ncbi:MAG TPA: pyridoxal phosphate-dependent aminotransferase [Mycobacteriales bacterium]|nr:pyridoxal phosphate-dependent aminotransferase [Mycobacteriales bacterium]
MVLRGFGTTIFAEMSALATATGSVNLGQGFPDTDGPAAMLDRAVEGLRNGENQYPPGPGMPLLRDAVARHRLDRYGLAYDPDHEILVTVGATEAIAASILGLCDPGDEVVLFEPYYDSYAATVELAGARRVAVTLRPDSTGRFGFDAEELRAAITPRTKVLLLNSPHNPTGTVLTPDELAVIAELCVQHDLTVVSDEVYEHLTYDGAVHHSIAELPGMRERCVAISSAGKSFSVTGWKIGWACAPAALIRQINTVKQFLTYTHNPAMQQAVAYALDNELAWVEQLRDSLAGARDRLAAGLEQVGMRVTRPQGTYFIQADIRPLGATDGATFARELPHAAGVVGIPTSVFCDSAAGDPFVRFAFCKRPEVIDEAVQRLVRFAATVAPSS